MAGIVSPLRFTLKLNNMKCTVIKEYAGIKEGTEVNISESNINYMVKKGYVRVIEEMIPIEPIQAKVVTEYDTKVIVPEVKKRGRKAK